MTMNGGIDREVSFKIMEHIGVLSTHSTGWRKELNLVSWNGGQPKYDIRDWDLEHEHMSRGVTLHEKEMRQIFELMKKRRMENRFRRDGYERRDDADRAGVPDVQDMIGREAAAEMIQPEESFDEPLQQTSF